MNYLVYVLALLLLSHASAELNMTARFLELRAAGETTNRTRLKVIPEEIETRIYEARPDLKNGSIKEVWEQIPGLLQRALLWDTGYVLGDNVYATKIFTRCGRSMAQIALPQRVYERRCNDANNTIQCGPQTRQQNCEGSLLIPRLRCAAETVASRGHSSMWAGDFNTTGVPLPELQRHQWEDKWTVFSIHFTQEPQWGECGTNPRELEPVIPCAPYEEGTNTTTTTKEWCRPQRTKAIDEWMQNVTIKIDLAPSAVAADSVNESSSDAATTSVAVALALVATMALSLI